MTNVKLCHKDGSPCHPDCDQWSDCQELPPTAEHLSDPYVFQLIQAISERDDTIEDMAAIVAAQDGRIKELEDGSCRFNCRTAKHAFLAGYELCHGFKLTKRERERLLQIWSDAK